MEIFATIFAGLGLFFIGFKTFGNSLQELGGRRFNRLLHLARNYPGLSILLGTLAGAVTHSTLAVTYAIVSMSSAGVLDARRGLPILIWANVGASVIVLIATLDMHLAIYILIGLVGICHYLKLHENEVIRPIVNTLLGFALLLFGLWMIKTGAIPLRDMPAVIALLEGSFGSLPLAFLVGLILSLITWSSSTVSAISVSFVAASLLNLEQALMIALGANLGAGVAIYLLSRHMTGTGLQLVLIQVWSRALGVIVLLPLLTIEHYTALPGPVALITQLSHTPVYQLAWAVLLLQMLSATLVSLLTGPLFKLAERIAPPDPAEDLARPRYLYARAVDDPDSALELLSKEHSRLLERLPMYLDPMRPEMQASSPIPVAALHPASHAVGQSCGAFLVDLIGRTHAQSSLKHVVNMQSRNDLLMHLLDDCREFHNLLAADAPEQSARRLRNQLIEGLHALLMILADTRDDTLEELEFLLIMSGDRSSLMEQMRSKLLNNGEKLCADSQRRLFAATTLLERLTWMIHSYAQLLARSERVGTQAAPVEATA